MSDNQPWRFYNRGMRSRLVSGVLLAALASPSLAQTPRPFPGAMPPPAAAQAPTPARPAAPAPAPSTQAPAPNTKPPAPLPAQAPADPNGPTTAVVGFSIFPGSQYLASYDAGKGQRYYLYGTTKPYLEVVSFYRTVLMDGGAEVYTQPLTHMFAQRFNEATMVFPPGVTVKDWTYQSKGYPNPRTGAQPERFPTVIMIVPPPPALPAAR